MTTHDRVRLQLQALEALLREHQQIGRAHV